MTTINEAMFDTLKGFGYDGALPDMYREYLLAETGSDLRAIQDLERELLASYGYSGAIQEMWFNYLRTAGYSNTLQEMLYAFWNDGQGFTPFWVPLTHTAVPTRAAAGTTATFTRATTSTWQNNDGYLVTGLAGEIGFVGARRVRNLLTYTEDLTNAAWIVDGGVTKTNSTTVTFTAVADRDLQQIVTTDSTVVGRTFIFSVTLALQSGTPALAADLKLRAEGTSITGEQTQNIGLSISSTPTRFSFVITTTAAGATVIVGVQSDIACVLTFTNAQLEDVTAQTTQTAGEYVSVGVPSDWAGDELVTNGTFDTDLSGWTLTQTVTAGVPTWDAGSMKMNSDGSGFSRADQKLTTVAGAKYVISGSLSGNVPQQLSVGTTQGGTTLLNTNIVATGIFSYEFTATGTESWVRLQDGGGTANSFDNISVKPAYYHGSFVDGVKCFPTDLSGNPIPSTTLLGYQAEGARTNLCLQSNALTTTWVSTLASVTQNAVGPDGGTTAWTLNDTDVGSVGEDWQNITLTAAPYTMSAFVKKTSGATTFPVMYVITGTVIAVVTIDTNNGVATVWTAYTGFTMLASASARCASYNSNYWRVELTYTATAAVYHHAVVAAGTTNATQSTGTLSATAQGSAVFYGVQVELGSFASSYLPTTTIAVARNADVLTYPSAGNIDGTKGWCYGEVVWPNNINGMRLLATDSAVAYATPLEYLSGSGKLALYDGTADRLLGSFTPIASVQKIGTTWGGVAATSGVNGTVSSPAVFDGDIGVGTTIYIGAMNSAGVAQPFGAIRNVRIGQRQLSASELQAITA